MGLVSRHLEQAGIATAVIGSAMDIIEYCGVPRYLHVDFPLGNPCGAPGDPAQQLTIVRQGLSLFEQASEGGFIVRSPALWPGADDWRDSYSRVDDSNREALRAKGEARRAQQAEARAAGSERAQMIPE